MMARLEEAVVAAGGVRPFARQHGVEASQVSRALSRERSVSEPILAALGLERIVTYRATT
mgnify:CR=1 FL=1